MDAKIKNIWTQNYANQSTVNIGIMQQNDSCHSSRNVQLHNANKSPQYFASDQILQIVPSPNLGKKFEDIVVCVNASSLFESRRGED